MKVKYVGDYYKVVLTKGKIYDVIGIEMGAYRIMTEANDDGLFPAIDFVVVEGSPEDLPEDTPENWKDVDAEDYPSGGQEP